LQNTRQNLNSLYAFLKFCYAYERVKEERLLVHFLTALHLVHTDVHLV